jgi:hypothetical protein
MRRTAGRAGLGIALAASLTLTACGGAQRVEETTTVVTIVKHESASRTKTKAVRHRARIARKAAAFAACDPNISVRSATTTCPFAQNVFYEYWASGGASAIRAYSPATKATYSLTCSAGVRVECTTAGDGEVRFAQSAVDAYSEDQASAYEANADTGPGGSDPTAGTSDETPAYADEAPGSDYDGAGSDVGTSDDADEGFCDDHECIPNYDEGTGSTVQCADGSYSHSGERPGACSYHGGVG